jgi:hypothetical protein
MHQFEYSATATPTKLLVFYYNRMVSEDPVIKGMIQAMNYTHILMAQVM